MSKANKNDDLHSDGYRNLQIVFSMDGRMEASRTKGELKRWLGATIHECSEDAREGMAQITSLSFVWSEVEETYWEELHRHQNELKATIRTTSIGFFEMLSNIQPGAKLEARLGIWEPKILSFDIEMPYNIRHPTLSIRPKTTWRSFLNLET